MKYHAQCLAYMLACLLTGWRVQVHGRNQCGHLRRPVATHRALSFRDALAWVACYGPDDYAVTVTRRGVTYTTRLPALRHESRPSFA